MFRRIWFLFSFNYFIFSWIAPDSSSDSRSKEATALAIQI
jgi:hypothetical protein